MKQVIDGNERTLPSADNEQSITCGDLQYSKEDFIILFVVAATEQTRVTGGFFQLETKNELYK